MDAQKRRHEHTNRCAMCTDPCCTLAFTTCTKDRSIYVTVGAKKKTVNEKKRNRGVSTFAFSQVYPWPQAPRTTRVEKHLGGPTKLRAQSLVPSL